MKCLATISEIQRLGAVSLFLGGVIIVKWCNLSCEVCVIIERCLSFCVEKLVTDSEADVLASELTKAGDVVKDFIVAILALGFLK